MMQPEKSELQNMIEVGAMWVALIIVISYFAISMGVVTFDDEPTPAQNRVYPPPGQSRRGLL